MKNTLIKAIKTHFQTNVVEVELEEKENIDDEIIKSLYELKQAYDLPTEEVELAVNSRNIKKP